MADTAFNSLNDKYLRLYGLPVSVLIFTLSQMPFFFPGRWDLWWKYALLSLIFTAAIWELARRIIIKVRGQFPDVALTGKRVARTLIVVVPIMGIGQTLITGVIVITGMAASVHFTFFPIWITNFACSLFFIVLIFSAYEAIYFFHEYKHSLQKAEKLKKQEAQQRLDALKNRVNPHFLFNSLTTLSALIGEDALRAEQFVNELSKVYRYLLRAGRQQTISLAEELQFAESYCFLLQTRFEEGAFSFSTITGSGLKTKVGQGSDEQNLSAMTLQNALDYLVRSQNLPLEIALNIHERQLYIICGYQPKHLTFDAQDHDWKHLEANGAIQKIQLGQLIIQIPFISNIPAR